jgi:hypothetical protein
MMFSRQLRTVDILIHTIINQGKLSEKMYWLPSRFEEMACYEDVDPHL